MSQFFFQLVLWLTRIRPVHSGHPPIPTWWYYENIFNDAVIALTHNYSTPAIMKKYVNVSAFSNLCSCKGTDGIFDDIDVVHFPNETTSAKHWVFQGLFPRQLTAGARYWDEHVCKNESTYTFYQKEPLQKQYPHLDEQMLDWFDKLESILQLLRFTIHNLEPSPGYENSILDMLPKLFKALSTVVLPHTKRMFKIIMFRFVAAKGGSLAKRASNSTMSVTSPLVVSSLPGTGYPDLSIEMMYTLAGPTLVIFC